MMALTNTVTESLVRICKEFDRAKHDESSHGSRLSIYILYLLWGDREVLYSHVYDLEDVHTGDDKEDARTPGSATEDPPQAEDDGLLVLLDHPDHQAEGEGEGDQDEEGGGEDQQPGAQSWSSTPTSPVLISLPDPAISVGPSDLMTVPPALLHHSEGCPSA